METIENNFAKRFEDLKSDFDFLDNWEDRYRHIIDMGKKIAPLSEIEKNDETKIRGCASQVWLVCEYNKEANIITFRGESDSTLVQGLLSILIALYSSLSPFEIINNPPQNVFDALNLQDALTPSRSNGLKSMASRIVEFAKENA
ncbi:MAG: SufE family protein [Proteobacteria bacterium]|nr:SufE family protein [Pseudomonadota bacterium]